MQTTKLPESLGTVYPDHDVRGGARPARPTSLPCPPPFRWHGFTGITVAIAQSHERSRGFRVLWAKRSHPWHPLDLADTQEACEPYAANAQHTLVSTRRALGCRDAPAIKAGKRHSRGRQIRACPAMSASLIGHSGSSAFRLFTLQCRCRSRARASLRNRHPGPSIMLLRRA